MSNIIEFKNPKDGKEFLNVFENICGITDMAFNKFEETIRRLDVINIEAAKRSITYLIGITKVISGLRGDTDLLRIAIFCRKEWNPIRSRFFI